MIMEKENFEAWMKEQKRILKEQGVPKIPKCPQCGKEMKNQIDSKTKELSEYLWGCDCKGMENFRLSRG